MFSFPRAALAPIPEDCSGEPSNTDSEATTDGSYESSAAKRAAVKRELPATRSVISGWPADSEVTEARGRVTLRGSADPQGKGMRAVCRIREGVLTMNIEERAAAGAKTEVVIAEVSVEALAVFLHPGRADMFKLAAVHQNEIVDDIYCFCDDPARRDRWTAVFPRMGVAVFDLRD